MKKVILFFASTFCVGCNTITSLGHLHSQLRFQRSIGSGAPPNDDGLNPKDPQKCQHWANQAKRVSIGMRRTEVERILPAYVWPDSQPHPWVKSATVNNLPNKSKLQRQWYYIAPELIAVLTYDHSGPLDWLGYGPNQRLAIPPVILHYDFTRRNPTTMQGGTQDTKNRNRGSQ